MVELSRAPRISRRVAAGARTAAVCVAALLLAACGGGGGDAAPAEQPAAGVQAVAITTSNQKAVAADALDTATNISAASAGTSFVTGAQVQGDAGATLGSPAQLAAAARTFVSMAPKGPATVTGVAVNESVNCALGGTISMTGDLAGGNAIVAGDTLTLTASNCKTTVEGVTTTMNGSMTLRVASGSYRTDVQVYPQHVVLSLTARSFSMEANGVTNTSNGDLQLDLNEQSSSSADIVLSGKQLANSVATSAGTRTGTLKDYRQTIARALDVVSMGVSATVEATNGRLGTVSYQVSTPVGLGMTAGKFDSGSLLVAGNKSALLVTVTGVNTFKLDLDSDGNGTYDASTTATLDELKALL